MGKDGKMRADSGKDSKRGIKAEEVPVSLIDENPDNSIVFNMDEIDVLAKGIEEEGFFGAICVFKKPDGRYEVSSGHRRLRAVKKLERKTIPCIISEMPDDIEKGIKLLSSNIRNREMKPMDWARAVKYFDELKKQAAKGTRLYKETAEEFFNMGKSNIYRYRALNNLIPELYPLVDDPEFAFSSFARAASMLNKKEQMEFKERLYVQLDERRRKIRSSDHSDENVAESEALSRTQLDRIVNDIVGEREKTERKERAVKEEEIKENYFDSIDGIGGGLPEDRFAVIGGDGAAEDEGNGSGGIPDVIDSLVLEEGAAALGNRTREDEFDTYTNEIFKLSSGKLVIGDKAKIKGYIKIFTEAIRVLEKML